MASSSNVPTRTVCAFRQAVDLPKDVFDALSKVERSANVILPQAEKSLRKPCAESLWIVVYDDAGSVELVASCTQGTIGKDYPLFIVSCKSSAQLAQDEKRGKSVADALRLLVNRLLEEVPPQRIFSVFAIDKVAEKFAKDFVAQVPKEHGIQVYPKPYYDATLTFCTRNTLKKPSEVITPFPEEGEIFLRPGRMGDLKPLAILCKGFSETSPPYILDDAGAELEAKSMIENQQVWVHGIHKDGQEEEIACLVATTRVSDNVTTVTKVFTAEKWRGRGCAARLLHRVCEKVLATNEWVVLYVGNSEELAPARKVYRKIGFQGLEPGQQVKGVERWLEFGFTNTDIGYW